MHSKLLKSLRIKVVSKNNLDTSIHRDQQAKCSKGETFTMLSTNYDPLLEDYTARLRCSRPFGAPSIVLRVFKHLQI